MTTTILTHKHDPLYSAISEYNDEQFTLCQTCDSNISRFWLDFGLERYPQWSEWSV